MNGYEGSPEALMQARYGEYAASNAYFMNSDPQISSVAGRRLDPNWWSRPFEYAFAMRTARGQRGKVADLGCGWWERPLKHGLVSMGLQVIAIDLNEEVMNLKDYAGLTHLQGDFIEGLPVEDGYFDHGYCISVLEDLGGLEVKVLNEFARVVKPGGTLCLTFDSPYNPDEPTPHYPGLPILAFDRALERTPWQLLGKTSGEKPPNIVKHDNFNLCVYHCLLGNLP